MTGRAGTTSLPGLDPAYATELLQRADALQQEAGLVVASLDLLGQLGRHGDVVQLGSSVSGLMTWRDIDFSVYAPGITARGVWEVLRPYLIDDRLDSFIFRSFAGGRNPTGDPTQERYYVVLHLEAVPGAIWKIDISLWLNESKQFQAVETEELRLRLTPEIRLAILWIKDIWRTKPGYPQVVGGVDIYRAVLEHGVRSPADFGRFLEGREPAPRVG
jgi:hypothetical protein